MPAKTHARLAPSAAHRWSHCAGSVDLIESLPAAELMYADDADEYTAFGTHCHEVAENILKDGGGTVTVEPEVEEIVRPYVEYVSAIFEPGNTAIEERVSLAAFGGPHAIWGTPDAQVWGADWLEIVDLKSGYVYVSPEKNEQLVLYAAGCLGGEDDPDTKHIKDVRLTVVQPRAGGVKTWSTTADEIRTLAREIIGASWDVRPGAPLTPGPWCRFCPAQGHCPALKTHASVVAQVDFDAVPIDTPPAPDTLPIEVAADLLTKVEVLDSWFNALRKRVTHELQQGRVVPGWKLVAKRSRRQWSDPQELVKWAEGAGVESADLWRHELVSPAQLEAVVGKKNIPPGLLVSVSSGLTLAPASDSRPAAALGPQEEFGALPPAIPDALIEAATQNGETP